MQGMGSNYAHVREETAELAALAGAAWVEAQRLNKIGRDSLREALPKYREVGDFLNRLQDKCIDEGVDVWGRELRKLAIPSQRASECRRIADHWEEVKDEPSMRAALAAIREVDGQEAGESTEENGQPAPERKSRSRQGTSVAREFSPVSAVCKIGGLKGKRNAELEEVLPESDDAFVRAWEERWGPTFEVLKRVRKIGKDRGLELD